MRRVIATLVASALLTACHGSEEPLGNTSPHGRYLGVGVFSTGQLWSKMVVRDPARDPSAATPAGDEHVIVVVDSQTGEIRECGDYSGVCANLNPWTKAVAPEQATPVRLTKHAADLAAEQKAALAAQTGAR